MIPSNLRQEGRKVGEDHLRWSLAATIGPGPKAASDDHAGYHDECGQDDRLLGIAPLALCQRLGEGLVTLVWRNDMEFYAIRVLSGDGTWSHLWTIFGSDLRHAMDRFMVERGLTDIAEINLQKRSVEEAALLYGRTDIGGGALEHPSILWASQPPVAG